MTYAEQKAKYGIYPRKRTKTYRSGALLTFEGKPKQYQLGLKISVSLPEQFIVENTKDGLMHSLFSEDDKIINNRVHYFQV